MPSNELLKKVKNRKRNENEKYDVRKERKEQVRKVQYVKNESIWSGVIEDQRS